VRLLRAPDRWHNAGMPASPVLETLETERLILRRRRADDAAVYRQLWTERDPRVPAHRRVDADGRPTVADIGAAILREEPGLVLLAVVRKDSGDVIGYCGLIAREGGSPAEPELAYELLRAAQGFGYATEAARAVVAWADEAGYQRLQADVWDWNLASRRVLRKLGFRETDQAGAESEHGRSLVTVRER
jgi:ribosomal-protein-alanine N-acetyltransferase